MAINNLIQYHPTDSPVHRLDPRVKILAVISLSFVFLRVDTAGLAFSLLILTVSAWLSRIRLGKLLRTLRPVLPFFLVLFLLYAFFTPGTVWLNMAPFPLQVTVDGLNLAVTQVGKFLLLVVVASLLTMTTRADELTFGLERILRPLNLFGISSHDLAMMVSLALRFIPEVTIELNTIRQAQLARGVDFDKRSWLTAMRTISYLAAPLVVNVLRRCDTLVEAMESRGYGPGGRTYLHERHLKAIDFGFMAALIPLAAIIILI